MAQLAYGVVGGSWLWLWPFKSTYNRELTFGALIGNQLFVHKHCTRKLMTSNTFGWIRNASLSKSRSCHVMYEFVPIHHLIHNNYCGIDVNIE